MSGWLAVGAVIAALGAPIVGPLVVILATASAALIVVSVAPRSSGRGRVRATRLLLLGCSALAARLVVLPLAAPIATETPTGNGPWTAVVESIGPVRDGSQVATLRLADRPDTRVAATLPRYPEIEPGLDVVVDGAIRAPPEGPYGDYLRRTGIAGTLQSRHLDVKGSEAGLAPGLERLRRAAGAALAAAIPEPEAGLAAGIVVGLRDRVDRTLAADFTTVGASHIVAISGWNIAIVAASVAALAGSWARRRRALLTAVAIVTYVAFAGASPSVVRAAAMAGVVLVARESGRAGRAAAALGWAAVILLFIDPALVGDAGFQLSSLATAGILAWATPLTAGLRRRAPAGLPDWLVESLAVSLAAQAATLPIVLLVFGRLAIISPLINLVVVPIVAPAMAAAGVALLGGLASMAGAPALVATILGLPGWFLLAVMVGVVQAGARLPFANATLEPPWNLVAAALAAAVPAAIFIGRSRRTAGHSREAPLKPAASGEGVSVAGMVAGRSTQKTRRATRRRLSRPERIVAIATTAALIALVVAVAHRPDGTTKITVIDVGQGDSILVEGGRGGRLLVDGGPDPDRLLIELDRRLPPWDRRLDAVILTHPHEDHVAGLALLLSRYRVGRVYETGMHGPGPGYKAWARALALPNAPPDRRLATGDRLAVDDLHLRVLWPDPGKVPLEPPDGGRGINDVSVVLLGEVAGRRILLTGDVEDDVDPLLVARGLPPIDVLKVAHHGSKTASTPAFLDVVKPAVAIVSAGAGNPYGHPARSTLDRLASTGARVLRTDTDGSVEVDIGASGIRVASSGGRAAAFVGRIGLVGRPRGGLLAGPTSAARAVVPGTPPVPTRGLVQAATPDEKRFALAARPVITFAFICAVPSSG
ncbi:MAG TPA: ComEC/Rec2 family competence protein [Candidatus Dormibacteraeota bacterium]|nr:ComEC/Rec2 family competence protein [Candidatus Dormibacteraeota bacterium]